MRGHKIVIIGGTACGPKAAARARRCDPAAEITIIEQGPDVSTATCGLPYYVSGIIRNQRSLLVRGPRYFKDVFDINVLIGTRALEIDRKKQKVEAKELKTGSIISLEYDKLVLATGSVPVIPKLDGIGLGGIFTLSTIKDANLIKNYLSCQVKKVVIVGAGMIGMEVAEGLVSQGIEVTIVDTLKWLLPTILDFEMAAYLEKHVKSKGIKLLFEQKVTEFDGGGKNLVKRVLLENDVLDADMVLLSIGRRPNISLARESGLTIGVKGGISVNKCLQTSDPAIYAGGDCIENINLVTGQPVLVPLGSTANKHGRIIGTNITGGYEEFSGVLGTAIAKVFDYNVARTGLSEQETTELGDKILTCLVPAQDHARYYPGFKDITVKLVAEKKTGRLLGGQIVGPGDVAKRIDVLATALSFGVTVDEMANIDLAYAPPFNNAMDPLHNAANVIRNKMVGMAETVTPMEVKEKIERGANFVLLDVRSRSEWSLDHIECRQSRLIPIDALRKHLNELPEDGDIITICHSSVRAYQALRILKGAGFKKVKFMDGSISAWPYQSTGSKGK